MSRLLPDYAGIFCLAVFIISITTINDGLFRDGDTFWHIKAGSVMLEQQTLIDKDIFSHTAYGTPWTAHEWLAEIIMASIYEYAGLEGITCFYFFIVSISFWILFKITERKANPWITVICMTFTLILSPGHMAARPHLFTWLLMMVTLAILMHWRKYLYWLPLLIIPWANLHGGFAICLVLQGIFILGSLLDDKIFSKALFIETIKKQKHPFFVLFLSLIACGFNPFGYELLIFPFQVSSGAFAEIINEWKPPNFQVYWYIRFYLVILVLLVSLSKTRSWKDRLLIIFFLNASLTHVRHFSLMLMVLTPFFARVIQEIVDQWGSVGTNQIKRAQLQPSPVTGPLLVTIITLTLLSAGSIDKRYSKFMTPDALMKIKVENLNELTNFLDNSLPEGKMFNDYSLGGYLLYAMDPAPKVFIDGRADMYGEQLLTDYNMIQSHGWEREKLLSKYDIDWIVFDKHSALIKDLNKSGRWRTTYANNDYAVLVRKGSTDPAQTKVR